MLGGGFSLSGTSKASTVTTSTDAHVLVLVEALATGARLGLLP